METKEVYYRLKETTNTCVRMLKRFVKPYVGTDKSGIKVYGTAGYRISARVHLSVRSQRQVLCRAPPGINTVYCDRSRFISFLSPPPFLRLFVFFQRAHTHTQ